MKNYNDFVLEYVDTKSVNKFEKDYQSVEDEFLKFWSQLDYKLEDISTINSGDVNAISMANEKARKVKKTKPTGQQPKGQQPTGQQPTGQQPTDQQPTGQQPTGQQPTGQQPTGQQPTGQQPTGQQPTDQQPKTIKPTGNKKLTYDEQEYPNQKPVHDKAYWQKYRKDHNHGGKYGPAKLEPEIVNPEAVQAK